MWVHVWNSNDNRDYEMTWDSGTTWKVDIPKDTYTSIMFLRVKPGATSLIWTGDNKNVYNETFDINFEEGKTTAQIVNWGANEGAKCPVNWVS